jgi:hypothetical protein
VFDVILLVNVVVGARDERTARRIGSDSRQPGGPEVLELGEVSTVEVTDQHKPSSASATDRPLHRATYVNSCNDLSRMCRIEAAEFVVGVRGGTRERPHDNRR